MSGLDWFDFADKSDIRAHKLYSDLITAKAESRDGWIDSWVKVPKKLWNNVHRGTHSEDLATYWTGFDWVPVIDYEDNKGRLYIRLPQYGEVAE